MKKSATILFLDYRPNHPGSMRKLDGVRRFFRTRSWDVVPVPVGEMCPETIPALLRRHRPAGCIVDCAEQTPGISKRLFGNVPVVYLDPPEPVRWRGAMVVDCVFGEETLGSIRSFSVTRVAPAFVLVIR